MFILPAIAIVLLRMTIRVRLSKLASACSTEQRIA